MILFFVQATVLIQAQSGWTKGRGDFFGKLDYSRLSTNKYYTPDGTALLTNVFSQRSFNLYVEYGFRKRISFIAYAPLLRQNYFESTQKVTGIGDLRLEFKYRLLKSDNWPVSISIGPELPTGRSNAYAQNKAMPLEKINLPTGDGEFNVWTTLAASRSLGKGYVSVFGAYNKRTTYRGLQFQDLYQFGGELGVNPIKPLWLNVKLRGQWATGQSKYPELGFVRGDGTTYTLISGEAFYRFKKHWGASFTYLTGNEWLSKFRNIYISEYFSIGIMHEFKAAEKVSKKSM